MKITMTKKTQIRCGACHCELIQNGRCPRCDGAVVKRKPEVKVRVHAKEIVRVARQMLGAKFVHLGKDPKTGIDCLGTIIWVAEQTGLMQNLNAPDYVYNIAYSRYPTQGGPDSHLLLREVSQSLIRKQNRLLRPSDVMFFHDTRWTHLGIYTHDDTMIHSYAGKIRRCVEHDFNETWRKRLTAVFQWPGVIYG